ncbi:MAG: xylulokinase [Promethearchaeota archaeon]
MAKYFLGLDCSTQSLTGILIDFHSHSIVYKESIIFDEELPHYNTQNGVYISDGGKVVHSNQLMWVDALELFFKRLQKTKFLLKDIKAISGSGQQHGTVYVNEKFEESLINLNLDRSISSQLKNAFSRQTSPIWMDSSTTKQCEEIRNALGGKEATIRLTGSDSFERFSGPQIRKFYQEEPEHYFSTSKIHLVSSFLSSILLGKNSPIDHGDGAGMNLMNIKTKQWDDSALEATAPDLKQKLPLLTHSYDIIGKISPYFVQRYNFSQDTILLPWSGDNPNSLIGVGLIGKGKAAISLGTSDTYFSYMKNLYLDLKGEGHVFVAPTGDYMSLICYKNGSLARERIKGNLTWDNFSEILERTSPGNNGKIILPYFFPEIVPPVLNPKVFRFGFDENDIEGNIRAIIEAQFLSMRLHSEWIKEKPNEIYATGGGSVNNKILQVASDIFGTIIRHFNITNSAALGAALRGAKSFHDYIGDKKSWSQIVMSFLDAQESTLIEPNKNSKRLYNDMLNLYRKYEDYIVRNGENPEIYRHSFIKRYFK